MGAPVGAAVGRPLQAAEGEIQSKESIRKNGEAVCVSTVGEGSGVIGWPNLGEFESWLKLSNDLAINKVKNKVKKLSSYKVIKTKT